MFKQILIDDILYLINSNDELVTYWGINGVGQIHIDRIFPILIINLLTKENLWLDI
ncbi:MAG TPA: hypothetical protein VI911_09445 [Patescibacteria group bacterium]|nr:MAG: hypothetical protein UR43_C0005G0129 [candidate division TM6 bacterium GW2011_GWF2_33_332]HLD91222.1 hypothetical protein [Patescibacteria group bacterium]